MPRLLMSSLFIYVQTQNRAFQIEWKFRHDLCLAHLSLTIIKCASTPNVGIQKKSWPSFCILTTCCSVSVTKTEQHMFENLKLDATVSWVGHVIDDEKMKLLKFPTVQESEDFLMVPPQLLSLIVSSFFTPTVFCQIQHTKVLYDQPFVLCESLSKKTAPWSMCSEAGCFKQ